MKLGAFSVSLSVKDLKKSQEFYEKMGFSVFAGSHEHQYLIMKNESTIIGLFQGMFDKNILTFNPGWDADAQELDEFPDVREIQASLKSHGLKLDTETEDNGNGPASFALTDPDGNQILIDQHVSG